MIDALNTEAQNLQRMWDRFSDASASGVGGAKTEQSAKKVIKEAVTLLNSDSNLRIRAGNSSQNEPGVVYGQTGSPELDNPASVTNLNENLEKMLLYLQLDNDERQIEMAETRLEAEKEALKEKHAQKTQQIETNIKAQDAMAEKQKTMKVIGWVTTALAVAAAVVTGGASIAASATSTAATTGATAVAEGTMEAVVEGAVEGAMEGAVVTGSEVTVEGAEVAVTTGSEMAVEGTEMAVEGTEVAVEGSEVAVEGTEVAVEGSEVAATEGTQTATTQGTEQLSQSVELAAKKMKKRAVMMGVGAAMTTTYQTFNETGVSEKATEGVKDMFKSMGLSEKDAQVAASVSVATFQIASTLAASFGAGAGTDVATGVSQITAEVGSETASVMTEAGTEVLKASSDSFNKLTSASLDTAMKMGMVFASGAGVVTQAVATDAAYKSLMAQADTTELNAVLQKLQQMMDETSEELNLVLEQMQELYGTMAGIIDSSMETEKEIAQNLGNMA